ncbi:MAG: DUF1592 domain-containing protein [Pirellulales bacterium]
MPLLVLGSSRTLAAADSWVESLRPFLQTHCLACHQGDDAKAGLRLDQLRSQLDDPAVFATWRKVVQRLEAGEMPPPGEAPPPAAETAQFIDALYGPLQAAARKRRGAGRTMLRRLNRTEYENTVRELFQVDVSVKEMLPEDATSHGFDNIGAALQVSAVLVERYLEAADALLQAAVAQPPTFEAKRERFDLYDSLPKWFVAGVWKQEDGVILFRNSGDSASDLRQYRAPGPGRYRFRISASAHNAKAPLPMAVLLGNFVVSGNPTRHVGYFDAPPGEPQVIEFEERLLAKNDTLKVTPVALPFVYLRHETMPDYPGPGLKIHHIEVEGPFYDAWPSESYRRVFGDSDPKSGKLDDARRVLEQLLPRAFRRPTTPEQVQPFVKLVAQSLEAGHSYDVSLRTGIKAVLASPRFLYFDEPLGPLDDYALASRLSYFLWSGPPDEELLQLAARGELHLEETLRGQVERMLKHRNAAEFTENFTGQWLSLRDIQATTPDKTLYPEFDELLQWSAVRETQMFFDELLRNDLSVLNVIDSDFTFLNARLADHYGIPGVEGVALRKVALPPGSRRGGVLTHASVLKVTANGTNTSPVVRGAWVLDHILGRPAPPPPPNVPAVEPDIRGSTTIREQLAKHRATENCAGCHTRIDPPGFALENYDAIGGWRDRYRVVTDRKNWVDNRVGPLAKYLAAYQYGWGPTVESSDALPDGREFTDIAQFKRRLLERPEPVVRCMTEKLVAYATGHPVDIADREEIDRILAQSKSTQYGLRSLVHAVVASRLFREK